MTGEEIKDELYRMLSDVLNGNGPIRNNAQRGRYREAVKSAIEAVEQKTCEDECNKCVYSTSEGCQYDDITETIPPFEDCIRGE